MDERIILNVFTDPMMGLSYESEPIIDRLKSEYGEKIEIRYIMSFLVRDISCFMNSEELSMEQEEGIKCYLKRLAGIYKSEEPIGGLPINMDDFRLFDKDHRTSKPLCLAYEAAKLTAPDLADRFLRDLVHATLIGGRPTTHFDEIMDVVGKTGIDEIKFRRNYEEGNAEEALKNDLLFGQSLGIHSLPAYLMQYKGKGIIFHSFDYRDFVNAINRLVKD